MTYANTDTGVPVLSVNTPFFGYFPTMKYDINNVLSNTVGAHEVITDVFFRINFIKKVINNVSAYYVYDVQDGETPEILAEKFYQDRGAGWVILYANGITDPLFEWPLPYDAFNKMIIDRYGSLEIAKTNIHHAEMVITRTDQYGNSHSNKYVIDDQRRTNQMPQYPYAYFTPWYATSHKTSDSTIFTADESTITADSSYDGPVSVFRSGSIPLINGEQTYELNGLTITESISGRNISYYDWELEKNDARKRIKVIKTEYYPQIQSELKNLTGKSVGSSQVRLRSMM